MKTMTYRIVFEDNEDYGNIYLCLREFINPIRLEVGDKIALSHASFDRFNNDIGIDRIDEMMEFLLKKSIKESKQFAHFEISDIIYCHDCNNDEGEFNLLGIIILKGK